MKFQKLQNLKNKIKGTETYAVASAIAANAILNIQAAAAATTINGNSVIKGLVGVINSMCNVLGAIFAAIGLFTLFLAFRNEDAEGKNKAAISIAAGIALFGAGSIIAKMFGTSISNGEVGAVNISGF